MSAAKSYRTDIEGLRGVAVLSVVAYHCGLTAVSGGFVGVDIFFVLSGYLITGLLVAEVDQTGQLDLVQFYARRIRRLLPAAALTLILTLAVSALLLAPHEFVLASRAARATAVYLSNVFFAVNASDYFAADVETNPVLHTWSLAVEEQFYVFWPLLILLTAGAHGSRRRLIGSLWAVSILSMAGCLWFSVHSTSIAFYSLPTRAWEFSVGGLAAILPVVKTPRRDGVWVVIGWLGLAVIVMSVAMITPSVLFPGWVVFVPVAGTLMTLIAGLHTPRGGAQRILDSTLLQVLGRLSYSWYLWHWPFLVFVAALIPNVSLAHKVVAAAAALLFAAATHRLVENPIRFHPYLIKSPRLTVALGVALTICSLVVAIVSLKWGQRLADAPEMREISAAVNDIGRMPREQCVALASTSAVKTCVFGHQSASTHIVLFGDSHAIQWFNPIETLARTHNWRLTTIVKSGCPASDVAPAGPVVSMNIACLNWRREAIKQIIALRPSLVLIGSATVYLRAREKTMREAPVSLAEWGAGTRRTTQALTLAGLKVAIIRDTPLPLFDIPTCLGRVQRQVWSTLALCDTSAAAAAQPEVIGVEESGVAGLHNVRFFDLSADICPGGVCRAVQDGAITFRDDNHLTGTFAERLAPILEELLIASLAGQ